MAKTPGPADAQVVLQLYDLRREAEMRKARTWWGVNFWPQSADDVMKVVNAFGSPENAWFRQVAGYWEMAASLVLRGAVNEDLFYDASGEMWFMIGKLYPYLKEFREKAQSPESFRNAEKLATRSKQGRERLERVMKRIEGWRKARTEAAKAS
jgi:hypothetical protein